jgi:hypothetical protein
MSNYLRVAIVALALAGTTLTVASGANAASVRISLNLGDVAYGYNDGYWDKGHQWHPWKQKNDMENYKKSAGNQYHDWKHDRDPDKGWHESDHK